MMTPKKKLEKLPLAMPNKNQFEKLPLALPNKNQFEKLPLTPEAAGSYMANLVPAKAPVTSAPVVTEPKVMASEATGGEGGDGSGKIELEYPTYQSYQDYVNGRESSILEAYDAAKKYAEQTKTGAHDAAKDNYRVAAREAAGNFRANQPTYGANAEQLLSSGLTGGGYSDYLAGKAYEARANEINAARSQMNYAMMLADQEYNKAIENANINKADAMNELAERKFNYSIQLNEAYKAKVDEAVQKIMDGVYDADVAAKILRNYTTDGQLSDDVLAILKSTEDNYWKANNSSMKSAFLDSMWDNLQAGNPVTEDSARQWLIDNVKGITEDEIAAYMDGYFKDGKLDKNAVAKAYNDKPQTGTTDNDTLLSQLATAFGISVDELKSKLGIQTSVGGTGSGGGTGGSGGGTGGSGGGTGGSGGTNETKTDPYTFEQTIDTFQKVVSNHKAKNAEDYKARLEELVNDSLVDGSKAWNQEAAEKIRNMASGLVVSSGTFDRNNGFQRSFQEGDNFHVTIGGESYRVDSQGYASDEIKNAAKDIADGAIFGYGSELYLKVGDQAVKIGPRPGIGNRDYDKLWRAVYGEQLSNIKAGVNEIKNEGKQTSNAKENTETSKENTEVREPLLYQAYMGVKNALDNAGQGIQNGVKNIGDFFRNIRLGNQAFGNGTSTNNIRDAIASVWPREENADEEPLTHPENVTPEQKEILDEINTGPATDLDQAIERYEPQFTRGRAYFDENTSFDRGLKKGDNFTVRVGNDTYKVESGGEVSDERIKQIAENVDENEVFNYGSKLYLKKGGSVYAVESRFFNPKQTEKLLESIIQHAGDDDDEITRGVAYYNRNSNFDRKLKNGENFTVEVNGKSYKVESAGEVKDPNVGYAANSAGITNGEVFMYGDDLYIKHGNRYYSIDQRFFAPQQDDKLKEAIKGNAGAVPGEDAEAIENDVNVLDGYDNMKTGKQIKLEDDDGNTYKVKISAVLDSQSAQYLAAKNVSDGEAFIYGKDVYIKYVDRVYKVSAVSEAAYRVREYEDLIKAINNEDLTSYSRYLKGTT